jgi:hypothetical protein
MFPRMEAPDVHSQRSEGQLPTCGSQPRLTPDEHRQLGEQVRNLWTGVQVAVVVPIVERVLIGEEAARAGGANIRTFTDLHEAGDWLLSTVK